VDRHNLTASQQCRRSLQAALDGASLVLAVLSPEVVASEQAEL